MHSPEELYGLLTKLSDRLGEVLDRLAALEVRLQVQCPISNARHEKTELILHGPPGNGKHPGLLTRQDRAEQELARQRQMLEELNLPAIEETMSSYKRSRDWFWYGVIGMVCTVAGAAVTASLQAAFSG